MRIEINLNHNLKGTIDVTISPAFQAQLDRATSAIEALTASNVALTAQVASLEAAASGESGPDQDAEDTAALDSALTSAGVAEPAAPVVDPTSTTVVEAQPVEANPAQAEG